LDLNLRPPLVHGQSSPVNAVNALEKMHEMDPRPPMKSQAGELALDTIDCILQADWLITC
jgi:hypothetical protein